MYGADYGRVSMICSIFVVCTKYTCVLLLTVCECAHGASGNGDLRVFKLTALGRAPTVERKRTSLHTYSLDSLGLFFCGCQCHPSCASIQWVVGSRLSAMASAEITAEEEGVLTRDARPARGVPPISAANTAGVVDVLTRDVRRVRKVPPISA